MDWETIYDDLKLLTWVVLLILSLFSYFLLSPDQTLGIIIGGLLIIINFRIFQHSICKIFNKSDFIKINKLTIILRFYIRLLFLGLVMFILIMKELIDPVGLAIGLSTIFITITILGIGMLLKMKDEEAL